MSRFLLRRRKVSLVVACAFLPIPHGAAGELSIKVAEDQVVISGDGFGSGANVVLYDDFENDKSVRKGTWDPTSDDSENRTRTSEYSFSGKHSKVGFNEATGRARIKRLSFPEPAQEVYLSYRVRLGEEQMFPGNSVAGPGEFSDDSSWKLAWLIDEDTAGDNADIAIPTYIGNDIFTIAGNSHSLGRIYGTNSWWSWTGWMRISVHLKPNEENPILPGRVTFQSESLENGYFYHENEVPIFPDNGHSPKQFTKLNIPGWARFDSDTSFYYDDVYVATGPNSRARVEFGSEKVYSENSAIYLADVDSWNDEEIRLNLTEEEKTLFSGMYVFVFDGDGEGVAKTTRFVVDNAPERIEILQVE